MRARLNMVELAANLLRLNLRVIELAALRRWVRAGDYGASYDRLAPHYDAAWLGRLAHETRQLVDTVPADLPPGDLLDLGCGTGYATRLLAGRFPDRAIRGCDISGAMLEVARSRDTRSGAAYLHAEMLDLLRDRPPQSAAAVAAAWSMGYADWRRVLRECGRVLAPGGCLAAVVNLADTLAPVQRAFRRCLVRHPGCVRRAAAMPFPRTPAAFVAGVERGGMAVVEWREGAVPIAPPGGPGSDTLGWLLETGALAGYDRMLPLAEPGPVAETFRRALAADAGRLEHHFVAVVARRPWA